MSGMFGSRVGDFTKWYSNLQLFDYSKNKVATQAI
jgi:hypothetical protein